MAKKKKTKSKQLDVLDDKVYPNIDITDELEKSYLDYAMSVIVSRALPDIRDGLNLFIEEFYIQCMSLHIIITSLIKNLQE